MTLDYRAAKRYALRRLTQDLNPQLYYHSLAHTRDEVAPAADQFASIEGVVGKDYQLLMTTVYFHDIGFIVQYDDHESVSIRIATSILPDFGFMPKDVDIIRNAIQATRLSQTPNTLLERILVDADLDNLGKEDFFKRSQDLRRELTLLGRGVNDQEWYASQMKFLKEHKYWTTAARDLRNPQKQRNIADLERLINQINVRER
jgi:uncharacterized protein